MLLSILIAQRIDTDFKKKFYLCSSVFICGCFYIFFFSLCESVADSFLFRFIRVRSSKLQTLQNLKGMRRGE